jgi:hypothetical protein
VVEEEETEAETATATVGMAGPGGGQAEEQEPLAMALAGLAVAGGGGGGAAEEQAAAAIEAAADETEGEPGTTVAAAAVASAPAPPIAPTELLPSLEEYLEAHAPDHLMCPISLQLLADQVVLMGDGCTYSRAAIQQHLDLCTERKCVEDGVGGRAGGAGLSVHDNT